MYPGTRFTVRDSVQHKLDIVRHPVVDGYLDIFRTALIQAGIDTSLSTLWDGHPFAICLTHDIDEIRTGWLIETAHAIKCVHPWKTLQIVTNRARGIEPWNTFDRILEIEKQFGAHSSFYFLQRRGKPSRSTEEESAIRNADYDILHKRWQDIITGIRANGSEIGIHGSIGSNRNEHQLQEDMDRLNIPVISGRFHYLQFDPMITWSLH